MSKKKKILIAISCFILVLAVVLTVVFLTITPSSTISQNILFSASQNVKAEVEILGKNQKNETIKFNHEKFEIDKFTSPPSSISSQEATFSENENLNPIIFTIKIKNLSQTENIKASLTNVAGVEKIDFNQSFEFANTHSTSQEFGIIYPQETYSITLEYGLKKDSPHEEFKPSASITLENVNEFRPSNQVVGEKFEIESFSNTYIQGVNPSLNDIILKDKDGNTVTNGQTVSIDKDFDTNTLGVKKVDVTYDDETLSYYALWIENPLQSIKINNTITCNIKTLNSKEFNQSMQNYISIPSSDIINITMEWDETMFDVWSKINDNVAKITKEPNPFGVDKDKLLNGEFNIQFIVVPKNELVSQENFDFQIGNKQKIVLNITDSQVANTIRNIDIYTVNNVKSETIVGNTYQIAKDENGENMTQEGSPVYQINCDINSEIPRYLDFNTNSIISNGREIQISPMQQNLEFEDLDGENIYRFENIQNFAENKFMIKVKKNDITTYFLLNLNVNINLIEAQSQNFSIDKKEGKNVIVVKTDDICSVEDFKIVSNFNLENPNLKFFKNNPVEEMENGFSKNDTSIKIQYRNGEQVLITETFEIVESL